MSCTAYMARLVFFFSSRRRHTRFDCDWSSDVCSSDLENPQAVFCYASALFRQNVASGQSDGLDLAQSLLGKVVRLNPRMAVAHLELGAVYAERQQSEKAVASFRSEEHTSELQSQSNLVCRLLLEKKTVHRVYIAHADDK